MRDRLSLRAEEVEFEELSWLLLLLFSFRALKCWSRKNNEAKHKGQSQGYVSGGDREEGRLVPVRFYRPDVFSVWFLLLPL